MSMSQVNTNTKLNGSAPVYRPGISARDDEHKLKLEPIPEDEIEYATPLSPMSSISPSSTNQSTPSPNNSSSPVPIFAPTPICVPQLLLKPNYSFISVPVVPMQTAVHVPLNVVVNNYNNYAPMFTQQTQVDDGYSTSSSDSSFCSDHHHWPPIRPFDLKSKFNRAKGNFYISKEKILEMVLLCEESFVTFKLSDEGLAFSYFKESTAIAMNSGQIYIVQTEQYGDVVIIDIDLHFKNGQHKMYLIAMKNYGYSHKVKWQIVAFMTKSQIFDTFHVDESYLPLSCRNMQWFAEALLYPPMNISSHIFDNIKFAKLHQNIPKNKDGQIIGSVITMREAEFRLCCEKSMFLNANDVIIPVVVNKNGDTWIEWKKPVQLSDNNFVCISFKWNGNNWSIECIDYDFGRLYYRHRLVGLPSNHRFNYSYAQVKKCCTTTVRFM